MANSNNTGLAGNVSAYRIAKNGALTFVANFQVPPHGNVPVFVAVDLGFE